MSDPTYTSPSMWDAVKDSAGDLVRHPYNHITGMLGKGSNPIASGNADAPYEGVGGAARKAAIDKAVAESGA